MAKHPFERMLYKALRKSTEKDNFVLKEAEALRTKGYKPEEVRDCLQHLHKGLIDEADAEIVEEALEKIELYCNE